MSRVAKPIETLLKLKQIKPDIKFEGADKVAYDDFLSEQAELSLMNTLKEQKKTKKVRKQSPKKTKQMIDPEEKEIGAIEVADEEINHQVSEAIREEESQ